MRIKLMSRSSLRKIFIRRYNKIRLRYRLEAMAREQASRYGVLNLYLDEIRDGASILEALLEADVLTPDFIDRYNEAVELFNTQD